MEGHGAELGPGASVDKRLAGHPKVEVVWQVYVVRLGLDSPGGPLGSSHQCAEIPRDGVPEGVLGSARSMVE